MIKYEYRCNKCQVVFECLARMEDRKIPQKCPNCEFGQGQYIVSAPAIKAWLDSDRWVKNRESHMKKEQKNMENHGSYD